MLLQRLLKFAMLKAVFLATVQSPSYRALMQASRRAQAWWLAGSTAARRRGWPPLLITSHWWPQADVVLCIITVF